MHIVCVQINTQKITGCNLRGISLILHVVHLKAIKAGI
jgi:hypothetical protein